MTRCQYCEIKLNRSQVKAGAQFCSKACEEELPKYQAWVKAGRPLSIDADREPDGVFDHDWNDFA